jgi:hypothetical protein
MRKSLATGQCVPPPDPVAHVFTNNVRSEWRRRLTKEIVRRLEVLSACGPYPVGEIDTIRLRYLRAKKAAWDCYLYTAFACGMFAGEKGADLLGRLRGTNPDGFRCHVRVSCMLVFGWTNETTP